MALAYSLLTRQNKMDEITTEVDSGAGAGYIEIYSGTRPVTGGADGGLLATLTMTDPSFAVANGSAVIIANPIADETAAAAGTASWFRVKTSTGTTVIDGDVTAGGGDLSLNTLTIALNATVSVTQFEITAGNA